MSPLPDLRRLGRFDVLLSASLLWFLAKLLRYSFPPLFGTLQTAYGVSNATLGTAFTGFMLAYAAMQFPAGLLADRFGSVRVIVAGALVAVGAAVAVVFDSPFVVLVTAMVVMGAGTGVHKTVAVELLSRTYPSRTGRSLGIFDTFGTFGGVVAPAAVVAVAGLTVLPGEGWRMLFLVAAGFGLAATALFAVRTPKRLDADAKPGETTADGAASDDSGELSTDGGLLSTVRQYASLFKNRRFAAFVTVTILFSFTYNGLVAFLPLYLTAEAGVTEATASLLYSALFAVSLVQLVSGEVSDRLGALPVIVAALGLASASLLALLTVSGVAGALSVGAIVVALGLGAHAFRPVRGAYLMSIVPSSMAGGGFGAVRALLMGAGAISPAIVGVLSETAGFRVAFALLAATLVAATTLASGLLFVGSR
ncbi:Sugar phosphate permease [Natronoarchaeum philippinense]|uniref:Sugar phosphate permease n=1 Tax=Natronoarchaeum philippinense TaxID=558529 RepID=A0A285MZ12_NATPI|nr:MFS transporter [Natronoarchaeum philippinense]SNZ02439.1 Sugar phosphate permease [Natronoarchaeum philippinense]